MEVMKLECSYKIGFMSYPFSVKKDSGTNPQIFILKCRNFDVEVTVSQCKLLMHTIEFDGIITSKVEIADKLSLGGFNSYCHLDEAETMFNAVQQYCKINNLELCDQYNNWPSFRGSINKKL